MWRRPGVPKPQREQAILALKPLEVHCISTEKEPNRPTGTIGKDAIPTGFDANNTGSCSFSRPVYAMRIRLWYGISNRSDNWTAVIQFNEPVLEISLPLPDHVPLPIIDPDLPAGPYLRDVWVVGYSDDAVEIQGFEHVDLVAGPIPIEDRPVEVEKPTAGPLPTPTPAPTR